MKRVSMKKKLTVCVLAVTLVLSLAACGAASSDNDDSQKKASTEAQAESAASTEAALEDAAGISGEAMAEAAAGSSTEALEESAMEELAPAEAEETDNEALESAFTNVPENQDSEISQTVLVSKDDDQLTEYQVVYYGTSSDILKAVHVEDHFYKSAGYTEETISNIDINNLYPGITELPYVKTVCKDEGDYICFIIEYNELDNAEHLDKLYDCNCKLEARRGTGQILSAKSYIELLQNQGAKEIDNNLIHSTYGD